MSDIQREGVAEEEGRERERDAEGGRWTEVKYSIISSLHNAGVHLAAREWSP